MPGVHTTTGDLAVMGPLASMNVAVPGLLPANNVCTGGIKGCMAAV